MPRTSLRPSIADSLDAPPAALPYLPEVLADLTALGSSPRTIARWLRDAGLSRRSTVLDLGCGKGAITVELAATIGCRVIGVDAFPPFIDAATALAARRGIADRCRFAVADARRVPWSRLGETEPRTASARPLAPPFDAALMIGLFDLEEAAAILRPLVRPGGLYLIDDAVSIGPPATPDAPLTRAEARQLLEEHGDRVIREMVHTPSRVRQTEQRLFAAMQRRATAIARRDPAARKPLQEFLRRQRAEAAALAGPVRPAMWLVRKRGARRTRPSP
jgi:SAM-dependent methyltransferase